MQDSSDNKYKQPEAFSINITHLTKNLKPITMQVDTLVIVTVHVKRPDNNRTSIGLHQPKYLNGAIDDAKKMALHYGHDPDRRWSIGSIGSIGSFFSGTSPDRKPPRILIKHFWYGVEGVSGEAIGKDGERLGEYYRPLPDDCIARDGKRIKGITRFPVMPQDQREITKFIGRSQNVGVYLFFHYVRSQELVSNAATMEVLGQFVNDTGLNVARKLACVGCDVARPPLRRSSGKPPLRFANAIAFTLSGHRPTIATYSHAVELDANGHKLFDKDHGDTMVRRKELLSDPIFVLISVGVEYHEASREQWTDHPLAIDDGSNELQQKKQSVESRLQRHIDALNRQLTAIDNLPNALEEPVATDIAQARRALESNIQILNHFQKGIGKQTESNDDLLRLKLNRVEEFLHEHKSEFEDRRRIVSDLKYWGEFETIKQRLTVQLNRLYSTSSLSDRTIGVWQQLKDEINAHNEKVPIIMAKVQSISLGSKTAALAQDSEVRSFRRQLSPSLLDRYDEQIDDLLNRLSVPSGMHSARGSTVPSAQASNQPSARGSAVSSARASVRSVPLAPADASSTQAIPFLHRDTWNADNALVNAFDDITLSPNAARALFKSVIGSSFSSDDKNEIARKLRSEGENGEFIAEYVGDERTVKGRPLYANENGDLFLYSFPSSPGSRPRIKRVAAKRHGKTAQQAKALVAEMDAAISNGIPRNNHELCVVFKTLSKQQQHDHQQRR